MISTIELKSERIPTVSGVVKYSKSADGLIKAKIKINWRNLNIVPFAHTYSTIEELKKKSSKISDWLIVLNVSTLPNKAEFFEVWEDKEKELAKEAKSLYNKAISAVAKLN